MDELEKVKKCKQAGCTVGADNKCLEGVAPIENCPHFYLEDNIVEQSVDTKVDSSSTTSGMHLFSGEEFSIKNVSLVTHKYPFNLIGIVGDWDCGKTTLLATLFDVLQIGPLDDCFYFAGSLTQIGFEKRCHPSREASKRTQPETEHTANSEFAFLHLALKKKGFLQNSATHLLLTDVKGERFEQARRSISDMRELNLLSRCDNVLIMLDGKKMADPKQKNAAIFQMRTFINMAIEAQVLNEFSNVRIVVSKWDLLVGIDTFDFNTFVKMPFEGEFGGKFKKLEFSKLAARPLNDEAHLDLGFGLGTLVDEWSSQEKRKGEYIMKTKIDNRYFFRYNFVEQ